MSVLDRSALSVWPQAACWCDNTIAVEWDSLTSSSVCQENSLEKDRCEILLLFVSIETNIDHGDNVNQDGNHRNMHTGQNDKREGRPRVIIVLVILWAARDCQNEWFNHRNEKHQEKSSSDVLLRIDLDWIFATFISLEFDSLRREALFVDQCNSRAENSISLFDVRSMCSSLYSLMIVKECSDFVAHGWDGTLFISSREGFFVVLSDRDNKKDLFRDFFFFLRERTNADQCLLADIISRH